MPSFNKHTIGVLGGMGPAATSNFLRLLIKSFNDIGVKTDSDFPRIVMLSLPLEDWGTTGAKDKASVASQISCGLKWLSHQDASVVAIPCNTVHEFAKHDERVVNIVDATLAECSFKSLGVLCSRQTRDSKLYEQAGFSISYFADQDEVDDVIANAMAGEFEDISDLIEDAMKAGLDTIVLGCTELSLCSISYNPYRIPIVDSSTALAHAVVAKVARL